MEEVVIIIFLPFAFWCLKFGQVSNILFVYRNQK